MSKREVDWTKPAYITSTSSPAQRRTYALYRCCHCKQKICVGERIKRGPRGRSFIHDTCVDLWKSQRDTEALWKSQRDTEALAET
jgi:hypothetical protein